MTGMPAPTAWRMPAPSPPPLPAGWIRRRLLPGRGHPTITTYQQRAGPYFIAVIQCPITHLTFRDTTHTTETVAREYMLQCYMNLTERGRTESEPLT